MLFFYLQELYTPINFIHKYDIVNIYSNIIAILYPGFALIYNIFINFSFLMKYMYNIWFSFLFTNKYGLYIKALIYNTIYYLLYIDKWSNRRFFKRHKRYRLYYKLPNIRSLKFLLFFYMLCMIALIWKRRNLYMKIHFITRPLSIYILSMLLCAPIKYLIGIKIISSFIVINIIFWLYYLNRR